GLPLQVFFAGLKQECRNLLGFITDLSGCHRSGCAGGRSAATGVGAKTIGRGVRIALFDNYVFRRDTKFLRYDLRIGRFMSLALAFGSHAANCLACWMDTDLGAIKHLDACDVECMRRTSSHGLSKTGDSNPHQFALLALFFLFFA